MSEVEETPAQAEQEYWDMVGRTFGNIAPVSVIKDMEEEPSTTTTEEEHDG